MKSKYLYPLFFILASQSQISLAGSINDSFSTGDTLSAQHLNNIKQAVNDNQTQVTNNNQAILSNTGTIQNNTADLNKVNTSTISNAKKITGNSKSINNINFSMLNLQPKLSETACDGFSYVQGFDNTLAVIRSTDVLGTGYTRTSPVYQDNIVDFEIEGIFVNNPVLMISGLGYDIERIRQFDSLGRETFEPGFSQEHDFVIETDGDDANNLIAYFDDPNTDKRSMSVIIKAADGLTIAARIDLFEFSHFSYVPSIEGRTRFTFVQSIPPQTPSYNIQLFDPFLGEDSFNPNTDTKIEIVGVISNFYPQVIVNSVKKTLTLTYDSNEGNGLFAWTKNLVQGNPDKRSMSVIQEENGIETSRKNYFETFPILWEIYEGFALDTKLKGRVVLSYDREEDG